MRNKRLDIIKDIISHEIIETQDELLDALEERNIRVTQATISRDIKELMLIKVPTGSGHYRYAMPFEGRSSYIFTKESMARVFRDTILGCDYSENILVIKTLPGGAGTVASALDSCDWPEIIGTVAGDDNIIAIVKPKSAAAAIMKRLNKFLE